MPRLHSSCLAILLALLPVGALAAGPAQGNTDARAILEQQRQIRADVEAGAGIYARLDAGERQRVTEKQDEVMQLLQGRSSVLDLKEADRIRVFNALEAISAIINREEDERMVCRRTRPIGTNRPQTVCRTVAQLRAERSKVEGDEGRRTLECSEATMGPGGCKN